MVCFSRALADFQSGNRHPATNGILRLPEKAAIALRCSASSVWIMIKLDLYTEGKLTFKCILGSLAWWLAEEALAAYWTTQLSINLIMLITKKQMNLFSKLKSILKVWELESCGFIHPFYMNGYLCFTVIFLNIDFKEITDENIDIYITIQSLHISNFPWKKKEKINYGS